MIPALLPPRRRARTTSGDDARDASGGRAEEIEDATAARTPTTTRVEADLETLRLLIVDDDFLFTEMLPRLLRRAITRPRLEITTARSPDDARRLARLQSFDVVLCDFDLRAQLSGVDVLAEVGRGSANTFRILITGHSPRELPRVEGAYDAFLDKPMTLREVVPQLASLLEERLGIRVQRAGEE